MCNKKINRNSVYCSHICSRVVLYTKSIRHILPQQQQQQNIIMTARCTIVLHCIATDALLYTLYLFLDIRVTQIYAFFYNFTIFILCLMGSKKKQQQQQQYNACKISFSFCSHLHIDALVLRLYPEKKCEMYMAHTIHRQSVECLVCVCIFVCQIQV